LFSKGEPKHEGCCWAVFLSFLFCIMASGVVMARGGHGQRVACGRREKGLCFVLSSVILGVWLMIPSFPRVASFRSVTFLLTV
jgi:hypothetical protein